MSNKVLPRTHVAPDFNPERDAEARELVQRIKDGEFSDRRCGLHRDGHCTGHLFTGINPRRVGKQVLTNVWLCHEALVAAAAYDDSHHQVNCER